jgi:hypothetical protein
MTVRISSYEVKCDFLGESEPVQGASMSEPPIHFLNYQQIKDREKFDESCVITRANFKNLVGDYGSLVEIVKCQVERKDTKDLLCGHEHQTGFVARRADDKEGLIGRKCADMYFQEHIEFIAKRSFVTRELKITDLIDRLRNVQQDETYLSKLDALQDRMQALRKKSKSLLEDLPDDVRERLRAMAKAKNIALNIDVRFMERVEDERTGKILEKANWVTQTIGAVSGIEIIERTEIIALDKSFQSIRKAFEALDIRRDLGDRKLRSQLKILETLPRCESLLAQFERQLQLFGTAENLRNLWLLSRRLISQLGCLRVAAIAAGSKEPTDSDLKVLLKKITKSLMEANENRDIRPTA